MPWRFQALGERALNRSTVSDRLEFAVLLIRRGLANGWHRILAPAVWLLCWPTRIPTRLLIAPQDIRTSDPTVAGDIYAGYFSFGGRIVNAHGQSPFDIESPAPIWAETLHGFGWLRHLRAADTALARANARALVEDWIAHRAPTARDIAWHPKVVSRRLLSWLSHSPVVLEGADGASYRRLMRSLGRQGAFLQRQLANGLTGEGRLWAALALAEIGICAEGVPSLQKQGSRAVLDELNRQILTDGGHLSRNPAVLVDLLLDLLPLRQAYAARGAEVPLILLNAIDRMLPMLRTFRHPDGSLALFNGMGVTQPDALATVLAYDDARAMALSNAPYSGYQRVEAGESVLICDTGRPPPPLFSARAHAGTLSFEFSPGRHRLIVNCGAPDPTRPAGLQASRLTAAHSTLVLADMSSSRFAGTVRFVHGLDGALLAGPTVVTVNRTDTPDAVVLDLSHDGYARHGFVHRRALSLDPGGMRLRGEDRLLPAGRHPERHAAAFAIRFHLHPSVRAAYAQNGRSVALQLPDEEQWLFEAGDLPVDIEESIFFAGVEGPRRTEQMVVHAHTKDVQVVTWSLSRAEMG